MRTHVTIPTAWRNCEECIHHTRLGDSGQCRNPRSIYFGTRIHTRQAACQQVQVYTPSAAEKPKRRKLNSVYDLETSPSITLPRQR